MNLFFLGILYLVFKLGNCKVIELDLSFTTLSNDGPWLVKFYAPWCGYCRKLEPIYTEFEMKLRDLPIKIGRLDATKFPEVSSQYQIRGYPTIKYINGSDVYTHEGDRTVQHLERFVRRAMGSSVKHLPSIGRFQEALEQQLSDPFFLYIGPKNSYLKEVYSEIAESLRLSSFFYSTESHFITKEFLSTLDLSPTLDTMDNGSVVVWKNDVRSTFHYKEEIHNINNSLRDWVLVNRFQSFPKVTHQDLWELEILQKPLVIFLVNSSEIPDMHVNDIDSSAAHTSSQKLLLIASNLLSNSEEFNLNDYQFVWSIDSSGMSDLAMTTLLTPNMLILQPWNSTVYLNSNYDNFQKLRTIEKEDIIYFLESFRSGNIQGYGGNSFRAKLQRAGYDFVSGLIEFITTTPLLAMFVIGIPLSVISFLCYAICCMDSGESDIRRSEIRSQKRVRKPLYEAPLLSSEEMNIKSDIKKKTD